MQSHILLKDIESLLNRNAYFLLKECEDALKKKLIHNKTHIDIESYNIFIQWYNEHYGTDEKIININKRKYSTTHRIEIAYKTYWKCGLCFKMLQPNFEIDHIRELRHGGKDNYDNCVALCVSCHSKKTRSNTLKKNKFFEDYYKKKSIFIENNIFENLKHKKISKYF